VGVFVAAREFFLVVFAFFRLFFGVVAWVGGNGVGDGAGTEEEGPDVSPAGVASDEVRDVGFED
jgi:hypothetical protein